MSMCIRIHFVVTGLEVELHVVSFTEGVYIYHLVQSFKMPTTYSTRAI